MEILTKIAAVIVTVLLYAVITILQMPTKARADDHINAITAATTLLSAHTPRQPH